MRWVHPTPSVSVFLQPEKRAPQTHINTLIYHRPAAPTQQGGKVTVTVPLQAAYTLQSKSLFNFHPTLKRDSLVFNFFILCIFFCPYCSPGRCFIVQKKFCSHPLVSANRFPSKVFIFHCVEWWANMSDKANTVYKSSALWKLLLKGISTRLLYSTYE